MAKTRKRRKKYKKYNISSKNINIDRIKNKYKAEDEIEILDDYSYINNFITKGISIFKDKIFYIWTMAIILIVLGIFGTYFIFTPVINLKGNSHIIINYKQKYKEAGYKASFCGRDISSFVKVKGSVKSKKLGIYKINYTVKYHGFKKNVIRYVEVKDISKPVITTGKDGSIYVCPGSKKYDVDSYKAYDNYDGDITKRVKVKKKKNYIIYSVMDKAHNRKVLKQKVIYKDKTKPEISFISGSDIHIFIGDKFDDQFKATDNCDGDITDKVKVTGKVDSSVPAEYKIDYEVTDNGDNTTKVSRKVVVSERNKNGTIYLTFDDGPNEGTTDVILDILKEEGVKATFFVTSKGPDNLIKREYDEGHTVALHTSTHDYSYLYSSIDAYYADLGAVSDRVKKITGHETKIVRFPGGSSNTVSRRYSPGIMSELTKQLIEKGYKYYDWNLSSGDAEAGNHTGEEIKNNVINNLSKDRINMVLMHDIKPYTRDALRDIIRYGKNNGYTFDKITMSTDMVKQKVNN